jgi:Electron transfer DM13
MKTFHIWGLCALLALAVAGCKEEERKNSKTAQQPQPTSAQQPQPASPAPQQAQVLRTGTFKGVSSYRAQGAIQIVKVGGVTKIILPQNFSVSSVPDPKLGFGNNGYRAGTLFAKLSRNSGAQEYVVPANVDLSKFNEIWIWCERFSVAIAVAKLN